MLAISGPCPVIAVFSATAPLHIALVTNAVGRTKITSAEVPGTRHQAHPISLLND